MFHSCFAPAPKFFPRVRVSELPASHLVFVKLLASIPVPGPDSVARNSPLRSKNALRIGISDAVGCEESGTHPCRQPPFWEPAMPFHLQMAGREPGAWAPCRHEAGARPSLCASPPPPPPASLRPFRRTAADHATDACHGCKHASCHRPIAARHLDCWWRSRRERQRGFQSIERALPSAVGDPAPQVDPPNTVATLRLMRPGQERTEENGLLSRELRLRSDQPDKVKWVPR